MCANATCAAYGCPPKPGQLCFCDASCGRRGHCCPDKWDRCGHNPSPGPGPAPSPVGPAPDAPPEQFHLAPGDTPYTLTVSYVTGSRYPANASCTVGTVPGGGGGGGATFTGESTTYTDGGWAGLLHAVPLQRLVADGKTVYYYACDGGPELSFTSPPPPAAFPFTVAAVADLGQECTRDDGGCPNATFAALHAAATAGDFGLLLHAGDIAYTSGEQDVWDAYHRELQPTAARVPYAVCPGNHEHYYNFSGYRHRFNMPGEARASGNLWYSFDWAGAHVVAISTEHSYGPGSSQYSWLAADLAAAAAPAQRQRVPWIVVMNHRPIYCSTSDYYDCVSNGPGPIAAALEPLLQAHGVDLALFGHLHNYERTWPVANNGTVEQRSYDAPTAPVHVVIGGAGCDEGLTNRWYSPEPEWSAFRVGQVDSMGYGRLQFNSATELEFAWILAANSTKLDGFTLTKTRSPPAGRRYGRDPDHL